MEDGKYKQKPSLKGYKLKSKFILKLDYLIHDLNNWALESKLIRWRVLCTL